MFWVNSLLGRLDDGSLRQKVLELDRDKANAPWKKIRHECDTTIFKDISKGGTVLSMQQCKAYFKAVGGKYFGQDLSPLCTPDIVDRFDWEGDGGLNNKTVFRALRKALLNRYPDGGEECAHMELATAGYTKTLKLGEGGQGSAWLVKADKKALDRIGVKDSKSFALKIYNKNMMQPELQKQALVELQDEFKTLKLLSTTSQHPHNDKVMTGYEIFQDATHLYCVNEVCEGGDLTDLRKNCKKWFVTLDKAYWQNLFTMCVQAVDAIHRHGVIHSDIKEPNIMLKTNSFRQPQIRIIDLGLAKACASAAGPGVPTGTPGYMPPETWQDSVWHPSGDMFSLGVTFFQLLADKVPDEQGIKKGIFQEGAMNIPQVGKITATREPPMHLLSSMPWASDFLPKMMAKNKNDRLRAARLLELPFFSKAERPKMLFCC